MPSAHTWKTPLVDAGTDIRQWQILLRSAKTGDLQGAVVPGLAEPLKPTDLSLNILKTVVTGSLLQAQALAAAKHGAPPRETAMLDTDQPAAQMQAVAADRTYVYEARVLQGIWAAAPYLHNGSVPSLAELLKPASARAKTFEIGPAYDIDSVGLAARQPATGFTLKTTGCDDRHRATAIAGTSTGRRRSTTTKSGRCWNI